MVVNKPNLTIKIALKMTANNSTFNFLENM